MIPVFKEHERNGVVFDAEAMDDIADENNLRIADTGDYVPIVLRHNEDGKDSKLVGFAGPFIVGMFGNVNPVAAIFAEEFRIRKEDREEVSRYPRLSVELWAQKDTPNRGFFDPICLLGSETPHLDLGVQRYARKPDTGGRTRTCYSMESTMPAAPAGNNTFVPAVGGMGSDSDREKVDSTVNEPTQYAAGGNGGSLTPDDVQQIMAALEESMMIIAEAAVAKAMAGGAGAGGAAADPLAADPMADPAAALGPGPGDELPPDIGNEMPGEENMDTPPAPSGEGEGGGEEGGGSESESAPSDDDKDGDDKPTQYRRGHDDNSRVDYKKAHDELLTKYQRMEAELASARGEQTKAIRYQRLSALQNEGILVNPDEEIADCMSMTDEQFAAHENRIRSKYARSRTSLPGTKPVAQKPSVSPSDPERAQYAKQARDRVEKYRKEGKEVPYKTALKEVYDENGKQFV